MATSNTMRDHSVREVQQHIHSKNDLYFACIRNGFYLPKLKSTIVTEEYIENVIHKKVLCPKFEDVRLKPCPSPPDK